MNAVTLFNAGRIVAGACTLGQLPALCAEFQARHVLVVSDEGVAAAGLVEPAERALQQAGLRAKVPTDTPPEPEVRDVERVMDAARAAGPVDLVVGIGGGSAMDVAKIVAVLLKHPVSL